MNDYAIIARMQQARVPPQCYEHSLESLGQSLFSETIRKKQFAWDDGQLTSYLVVDRRSEKQKGRTTAASATVPRICGVVAKELVLLRQTVTYLSIPHLVWLSKDTSDFALGKGYVVVGAVDETSQAYPAQDWHDAQAILLSHFWRGGGLILGDVGAIEHGWLAREVVEALDVIQFIDVQ